MTRRISAGVADDQNVIDDRLRPFLDLEGQIRARAVRATAPASTLTCTEANPAFRYATRIFSRSADHRGRVEGLPCPAVDQPQQIVRLQRVGPRDGDVSDQHPATFRDHDRRLDDTFTDFVHARSRRPRWRNPRRWYTCLIALASVSSLAEMNGSPAVS